MALEKDIYTLYPALGESWRLQLGREVCGDVQAGLNREWLVTNGLGGSASGSIVGATTRCYHGLLVAALHPPVERMVLVTKLDEEVVLPDGQTLQLGVNEYQDGTIDPQGYNYLQSVVLDGDVPCFTYRLSDALSLEKRIWMEYGQNTTYVQYTLHGSLYRNDVAEPAGETRAALQVKLFPFCLARDYHSITQATGSWQFGIKNLGSGCQILATEKAPAYQLLADPTASFHQRGMWYWHVWHRRDNERGLAASEDVYQPGFFEICLAPGMRKTLVLSAEPELAPEFGRAQHEEAVAQALQRHQRRTQQLLSSADHATYDLAAHNPLQARLALAADQFIVVRPDYTVDATSAQPLQFAPERKTIIAGYPWFTDWGRDSMISLPGLLLHTGRYGEARGLLKAFARFEHNGLIPNRFPDGGEPPVYNTADATLWMFHAIDRYLIATNDWSLLKELFSTLHGIIQCHVQGTDFGICADADDGLLRAGAADVQLTWMDARVGDWIVTPRRGKPVEVNALWYNALRLMEAWAVHLSIDATSYSQLRSRVQQHFAERFWYDEGGYLYDVVDSDGVSGRNDSSLRPNQLLAASLTSDLLSESQIARILKVVTGHLLTPAGLRSLSPQDPHYHSHFEGDQKQRDGAYHQGVVWQWLIGPYIDVHLRVYNDRDALLPLLLPLVKQLWSDCLGTISEVAEPEAPYTPGGCFAQAWSVAELLRCWLLVSQ